MRSVFSLAVLCVLTLVGCGGCSDNEELGSVSDSNLRGDHATLNFSYSPDQVLKICDQEKERVKKSIEAIASSAPADATFESVVVKLEHTLTHFSSALEPVSFLKYVSDDEKVRTAADTCEEAVQKLYVDIFAREDLYQVIKAAAARGDKLAAVDAKLLDEYLVEFKRNGLELTADKRKVFTEKKKQLVELTTEFDKNLLEWKDHLELSKDELDGLPEDYVKGLEKAGDKYKVTLSYPDYFPFMENGTNVEARKKLQVKFFNRGGDRNRELLEKAITLRHELANLLGFKNHAEFVLDRRMAKKPEAVRDFLTDIRSKLKPKGEENLKELLALKQKDDPTATKVNAWDWRYYENQLKKTKYKVDHQKIKEYFPLEVVNKGMFEIYETLLNVDFQEDKTASKWHSSVLAYKVIDNDSKKQVARFFMDLFPRKGKYGHAAAFTLLQGYEKADGTYQMPVSSIVANFNAPVDGQPSLLTHGQVETHFHEFGHIMHQVLTKAKYATFSGTSVKRDFVEAPSQMLENWVWNKSSLMKLSGHYKDPSKPLPDALLNSLLKAKLVNSGVKYLRQVFFGTLDMTYHTSQSVDSTQVYDKLAEDIMLIPIPKGTQPQASFGHLMGGYDAGYYGYLWSEVFAQDMFTRFEKEGLLSAKVGADYRKNILEMGGTQDPFELITAFLGRAPNNTAFLKSLGLEERAVATKE